MAVTCRHTKPLLIYMMRKNLILSALLLLPLLLESAPLDRIQNREYFFKEAGKRMNYTLFVPSSYSKKKAAPLFVMLHGLFGFPQQIIRSQGLVDEAEKHGFLVVCPMGYDRTGWYGSRGHGQMFPNSAKNQGKLSEMDVMNVLSIVRREFNIDPKRIYLGGHSMGGTGTLYLGSKHSNLWAGLVPIAPWLVSGKRDLEKTKHLPVVFVQGDADNVCWPIFARGCVKRMKQLGNPIKYIEEKGGGHVGIVNRHWPEIFKFFQAHARK